MGVTSHPLYDTWKRMVYRCTSPKATDYAYYGGRGIDVCERWRDSFDSFVADMGDRPPGMTIERKNNSLGYSPTNCIWATRQTQSRNTRWNRMLTFRGETKCVGAWAEELGMDLGVICHRLDQCGWSVAQALTTPLQQMRPRASAQMVELHGETKSLADWCRILGFTPSEIGRRTSRGWSVQRALSMPVRDKAPNGSSPTYAKDQEKYKHRKYRGRLRHENAA